MDPYDDVSLIRRLRNAVETLESGAGPIQERLYFAYMNYLSPLQPKDFPDHRQEEFAALEENLTWIPAEADEGTAASTFKHMTDEEAGKWAQLIVELYADLSPGSGR